MPATAIQSMRSLLSRISEFPLRVYRAARHLAEWLLYDRRQETDTGRQIELEELGVDHPDRQAYQPTRWSTLKALLPQSSVAPGDVFVDFGSGMGRIVQAAADYPFSRLIGVEVSEELNEVARRNFARNRDRFSCQDAEFIACDAVDFPIPDDMTYAYFFNPFTGETFRRVLENIITSIDRNPRRVVLLYHQPLMQKMIESSGRFRLLEEKKTSRTTRTRIYESVEVSGETHERPAEKAPAQPAVHEAGFRRPAHGSRARDRVRAMNSDGLPR